VYIRKQFKSVQSYKASLKPRGTLQNDKLEEKTHEIRFKRDHKKNISTHKKGDCSRNRNIN